MVKKISVLALSLLLTFSVLAMAQQEIKNPDTLVRIEYGTVNTLDPAYSYDTSSGAVIFNVYENLVMWPAGVVDADETDLSYSLATADLLPMLATVVPSVNNGLIVEYPDGSVTYQFPIRENVKFHEGGTLTPEDVEYSFERGMLQDRDGGPQWMLIEPLTTKARLYQLVEEVLEIDTNKGNLIKDLTPEQQAKVYNEAIDPLVEVQGMNVVFHLPKPYPPFLSILAHAGGWGAILDREWVAEQGGWDGAADTWAKWYNPGGGEAAEDSELYDTMNGTGPYKLGHWDPGVEVVYERFDEYWREPASIKTVVNKKIQEWSDRLLLFGRGDADICSVDPQYLPQVVGNPGIVTTLDLPTLGLNPAAFFTSDLNMQGNDLVGSGQLVEDGIPAEFFNDVHLRKAFSYAFEYQTYIDEVLGVAGGYLTHGPVPKAFEWAYNDDPALYYNFDMEKATEEMKLAHDGAVWETGFTFTLLYNEGNQSRRVICEILEKNIESMNPKFHIDVRGVPWASYLDKLVTEQMPLFVIGWLADFPDPHNFVMPFAHSTGTFSGWQGATLVDMFTEDYDPLITRAMETSVQSERADLYYQIEEQSFEDCYDIWLPQVNGYRVMRDWVQGYAFNPIFPDVYYYSVSKGYE
jgi:peptide/nickel transport system substrate-binding protein